MSPRRKLIKRFQLSRKLCLLRLLQSCAALVEKRRGDAMHRPVDVWRRPYSRIAAGVLFSLASTFSFCGIALAQGGESAQSAPSAPGAQPPANQQTAVIAPVAQDSAVSSTNQLRL